MPDETSKPGDLIEVEWIDSERVRLGWADRDEYVDALKDRTTYFTAGYLVEEDDAGVVVSHSKGTNGLYCDAMKIPKAAVVSRRRLRGR